MKGACFYFKKAGGDIKSDLVTSFNFNFVYPWALQFLELGHSQDKLRLVSVPKIEYFHRKQKPRRHNC